MVCAGGSSGEYFGVTHMRKRSGMYGAYEVYDLVNHLFIVHLNGRCHSTYKRRHK